jgi:chorismate mutase
MRRIFLLLLFSLTAIPACRPTPPPVAPPPTKPGTGTEFDGLLGLMRRRLDLMHDVARWKWSARAAIEDPAREAALLDDVANRGRALGLDPATTRAFFGAQIEAAKLVQRADFRRWVADRRGPAGEAPDLAGVLRPRIDALNRDLLAALSLAMPRLQGDGGAAARIRRRAEELLAGDEIDPAARAEAIRPLMITSAP